METSKYSVHPTSIIKHMYTPYQTHIVFMLRIGKKMYIRPKLDRGYKTPPGKNM